MLVTLPMLFPDRAIDELNRATERLAELLMNSAVQSALEGKKLAEV